MASRKCDRCGGKASPWIPRKRNNAGDQMLCAGCKQSDRSARLASVMKVAVPIPVQGRRPSGTGTDFGWENDLAPEGYHPLMAPLPTSVWERYAKKQELRGKPLVPMASQRIINARMRGDDGRTASLRTTAQEDHGAGSMKGGPKMVQHLEDHHGMTHAQAYVQGISGGHHYQLHNEGADHTHGPDGVVIPHAAPKGQGGFGSMSPEDKIKHLIDHHGVTESGAKAGVASGFADTFHPDHHAKPGDSTYDLKPHIHQEGDKLLLSHPDKMGQQGMNTHLLEHHGISGEHIGNAADATSTSVPMAHVVKGLHNKAHSMGVGTDEHKHEGYDHGSFVHQTPHSSEEHLAHLKHAHGMTDGELEEYKGGAFGGTHGLAHVHDDLHSSSVTGHEHSGHMDVGKPFTGVTTGAPHENQNVKVHLAEKHGMSPDDLHAAIAHLSPYASDHDEHAVWEKHHGELHKQLGEAADHQHVPTVAPGVKPPEQVAKEAMQKHLMQEHGKGVPSHSNGDFEHKALHDAESFGYKGHPGHEHGNSADPTEMTQHLPHLPQSGDKTGHSFHFTHPSDMKPNELSEHMLSHHDSDLDTLVNSHEENLQAHAQAHATGALSPHTHETAKPTLSEFGRHQYGGKEPEPQENTHPMPEDESSALAHVITHHPNISAEHYKSSKGLYGDLSMQDFHQKLHTPKSTDGYALPTAPDGHDHAEPQGPNTGIAVGSHLVSYHGLDQSQVAAMSPAEFKAHHEELHARHHELDIGHGHLTPGGPVIPPRSATPNPHHAEMRGDPDHPAVHEWYHGTSGEYDGPPKNATELQEDHGRWGNFGGGDWNNHAGTHWTSLHQMARDFNHGGNRVIHAKLHMSNPIKYNSLNHMSHDAYDRLHASGDIEDDGHFLNNHDDDNGYNHCCSDRLLDYAKGGHRSDGKFGMERYRDSLRASGHDGIVVRNQADSPNGHWNAVPLSADQVEITHASCHGDHGDERDLDTREFNKNKDKLTKGWVHPKDYDPSQYTGGKALPAKEDVDGAGTRKSAAPEMPHIREGRGNKRGDADPYRLGRDLGAGSNDDDDDDDDDPCEHCDSTEHKSEECDAHFCEHCDEWGNHDSNDCDNQWCSVCDEHGSHSTGDGTHPHCEHCDEYAEHSSDEHEDEWGEHPDKIRPEGYCPSCEESTKQNYGQADCTNCGEKLPDWGKMASSGTPVKPGEYSPSGETSKYDYGPKKNAPSHKSNINLGPGGDESALAAHLYHHHMSDVGGKEYENDEGEFDHDKLHYHHKHLHADPAWAKEQGFTVDHAHPTLFPQYKSHESMTPAEVHAHMLLSHASPAENGAHSTLPHATLLSMTSAEAVEHHKKIHAADDAIPWGSKDEYGDLKAKIAHSHQLPDDHPTNAPSEHSPKGDELADHLASPAHKMAALKSEKFKAAMSQPGVMEAIHQHVHDSFGASADPTSPGFHTHSPQANAAASDKQKILDHLAEHHGIDSVHHMHNQYQQMNPGELVKAHDQEHHSMFPMGKDPEHTHFGKDPHDESWTMPNKQSSLRPTLTNFFEEVAG